MLFLAPLKPAFLPSFPSLLIHSDERPYLLLHHSFLPHLLMFLGELSLHIFPPSQAILPSPPHSLTRPALTRQSSYLLLNHRFLQHILLLLGELSLRIFPSSHPSLLFTHMHEPHSQQTIILPPLAQQLLVACFAASLRAASLRHAVVLCAASPPVGLIRHGGTGDRPVPV